MYAKIQTSLIVFGLRRPCIQESVKLRITMTGAHLLIAAVIIVFVIAFIITILVLNANAKKIISANTRLVENQNMLLSQNKMLVEQLKHSTPDEVMQLRKQTRQHREHIEVTTDMTDEELMAWIDQKMEETRLFTDPNLTLKALAKALVLTQKRLGSLFKNHPKYTSFGEYVSEKRFLYACHLLREEPNWTIEAVGTEAGFGGRRTFQTEVKRRLGITPLQYRQSQSLGKSEE